MFLNNAQLPDNEVYFSEILRKAGYNTGYIGKWHLDGHGRMDFIPPERRRGFEYWKVAECDHNYNHSHYYAGNSDKMLHWEVYDVFAQTKDAQQFIRKNANEKKPFALVLSYGPPHRPFDTAPEVFEGDDLSDRLRKGKDKANHAVLYMGVAPFNMSKEERTAYRAGKTNRYTYVRSLEGPWLLYDDASDPFQLNNLVDQPEYASLRNDLDDQLQELLEKIGDDFRAPSDYIEEWGYEVHPRKGNIPPKLFSPQAQYPKRK
jgi:hypothetical protein